MHIGLDPQRVLGVVMLLRQSPTRLSSIVVKGSGERWQISVQIPSFQKAEEAPKSGD